VISVEASFDFGVVAQSPDWSYLSFNALVESTSGIGCFVGSPAPGCLSVSYSVLEDFLSSSLHLTGLTKK
jgi:hypothetical protein